jgi:N,N'-diacetyl-8-epilegionaminate cytidylyltransferase
MEKYVFIFSRRGSKRLKNKSLQKINKKTLFEISLKFALKLKDINKIFVSTDDERIKKIALKYQCEVIDRPKHLASSSSPEILSWKHAVNFVQKKYSKKFFFISLPVTAPLRKKNDVIKCVKEIVFKKKDIAISVTSTNQDPFFNMLIKKKKSILPIFKNNNKFNLRSGYKFFCTTTVCYVTTSIFIKKLKNLFSGKVSFVEVPFPRSIDIDTKNDLKIARIFSKN